MKLDAVCRGITKLSTIAARQLPLQRKVRLHCGHCFTSRLPCGVTPAAFHAAHDALLHMSEASSMSTWKAFSKQQYKKKLCFDGAFIATAISAGSGYYV